MQILEDIPLAPLTTFKIGGKARFFAKAKNRADLVEAILFARSKNLPIFVLGGGSNILVSDSGFSGLVVKMEIDGIESVDCGDTTEITAGAGVVWDDFVEYAVSRDLRGVENLSAIPGTVGGAVIQNIGAYGAEAKDTISRVDIFDAKTLKFKTISSELCHFGYRDSIFKHPDGKNWIVVTATFSLSKKENLNTSYRDIAEHISKNNLKNPTLRDIRNIVVEIRKKKLPDLSVLGTAGSFFKNPIISKSHYEELLKKYPELPSFPVMEIGMTKISAAWILDKICGFKGLRDGPVGTYKNQALVVVNFGGATAADVNRFAGNITKSVKDSTGITLEREVLSI